VTFFGLANGSDFRLERTALNQSSAETTDNAGIKASGPIIARAPESLASRLPLDAIAAALAELDVPFQWSSDAGGYVCNDLFFRVLHHEPDTCACGLIHIPPLERFPSEKLIEAGAQVLQIVATSG
jgi:pyroglutamyl-peptidase